MLNLSIYIIPFRALQIAITSATIIPAVALIMGLAIRLIIDAFAQRDSLEFIANLMKKSPN